MLFFLLESLNALEDQDLDALMADLVADISEAEQRTIQAQKESSQNQGHSALLEASDGQGTAPRGYGANAAAFGVSDYEEALPPPPADPMLDLLPPPPPPPPKPLSKVSPQEPRWQHHCYSLTTHHLGLSLKGSWQTEG